METSSEVPVDKSNRGSCVSPDLSQMGRDSESLKPLSSPGLIAPPTDKPQACTVALDPRY